ncbi:MAG: hypothetical protein ACPGOV_11190 [Magnetovibrionaceae bacterium]
MKALLRALAVGFLVVATSGCYFPIRFDAEIELSRYGSYTIHFDGYMTRLQVYDKLRKREMSRAEERAAIETLKTDVERDSATQVFEYIRDGIFRLGWQKSGDLFVNRQVTFLRRNELILEMRYLRDEAEVLIEGKYLSPDNQRRLLDMGLNTEGQVRVLTDAAVTSHSANFVADWPEKPGYKMYTWKVENVTSPSVRMKIAVR